MCAFDFRACLLVGIDRSLPPIHQPKRIVFPGLEPVVTKVIVVPPEENAPVILLEFNEIIDGFHGLAPSIDVIPKKNKQVVLSDISPLQDLLQGSESGMYVPDDQCSHGTKIVISVGNTL
jgi:hypothetical protein